MKTEVVKSEVLKVHKVESVSKLYDVIADDACPHTSEEVLLHAKDIADKTMCDVLNMDFPLTSELNS